MATRKISRSSIFTTKQCFSSLFIRSYTKSASQSSLLSSPSSYLSSRCLRPVTALTLNFRPATSSSSVRFFNSDQTNSDSNSPNKSSPPEETDVFDGCDYKHWSVEVDLPEGIFSRNEGVFSRNDVIDFYIKTLATIIGSEEEARMKIYNVRTRGYYAFGVLMSRELAYKMIFVENVRSVIPDSYWDAENKDYGGEQFINGQAMPYNFKYAFKLNPEHVTNWTRRFNERSFNERISRNVQRRNYMGRDPQNMLQNNMGGISQDNFGGAQKMGTRPNYMVGGVPIKKGGESFQPRKMTNSEDISRQSGPGPNSQYQNNYPLNMPVNGSFYPKDMGGMSQNKLGGAQNMGRRPNCMVGRVPKNRGTGNFQPGKMTNNEIVSRQSGPGPNTQYQNNYPSNMPVDRSSYPKNMGGMSQKSMGGVSQNNLEGAQNMGTRPNYMVGRVPINRGAGNFQPRDIKNEDFSCHSGPRPNSQYQNSYPSKIPADGISYQTPQQWWI